MYKFVLYHRDNYVRELGEVFECKLERALNNESSCEIKIGYDIRLLQPEVIFNYRVGIIKKDEWRAVFIGHIVHITASLQEGSMSLTCKDIIYYLKRRVYQDKQDYVEVEQSHIVRELIRDFNRRKGNNYVPHLGLHAIGDTGVKMTRHYLTSKTRAKYPIIFELIQQLAEKRKGFLFYNRFSFLKEDFHEDMVLLYPYTGRDRKLLLKDGFNCNISELEVDGAQLANHIYLESTYSEGEREEQVAVVLENEKHNELYPRLDRRKGFQDIKEEATLREKGYPLLEVGRHPLQYPDLQLLIKTKIELELGDAIRLYHKGLALEKTRFLVESIEHDLLTDEKNINFVNMTKALEDDD